MTSVTCSCDGRAGAVKRRRFVVAAACVLALAALVNMVAGVRYGLGRPLESDAFYFRQVALSLAHGRGCVVDDSFWPGQPTMQRLPGWPFAASLALRLAPHASPDTVMRSLCLGLNALVAPLIFVLTLRLFGRLWPAVIAGVAYALHPTGLYFAVQGLSETVFLMLCSAGLILLLRGGWSRVLGLFVLGLSCLERANFVLWAPMFVLLAALAAWRARPDRRTIACAALGLALFAVPIGLWTARNYGVCGRFPVISTLRGQTFYGGNNPVVADDLRYWGYWIFPNSVPGERPLAELAQTMSESDVDVYYFDRGKEFIRANALAMPRLWLGKLVRAYVPVPWVPSMGAYAVGVVRIFILMGAIAGIVASWRRTPGVFRAAFLAMLATNVATVVLFWGNARFAFSVEPFLLPFLGVGLVRLLAREESA